MYVSEMDLPKNLKFRNQFYLVNIMIKGGEGGGGDLEARVEGKGKMKESLPFEVDQKAVDGVEAKGKESDWEEDQEDVPSSTKAEEPADPSLETAQDFLSGVPLSITELDLTHERIRSLEELDLSRFRFLVVSSLRSERMLVASSSNILSPPSDLPYDLFHLILCLVNGSYKRILKIGKRQHWIEFMPQAKSHLNP